MAKKSAIFIVTDHKDYAEHIELCQQEVGDIFERKFDDYPPITKTKYRLKAEAQGIESNYFYLMKK